MKIKAFQTLILLIITATGLGACSYSPGKYLSGFDRTRNLQINQAFSNLHNGHYLYFQNGARVAVQKLDRLTGYCSLYVYDENHGYDHKNSIQPGNFQITGIRSRKEIVDNFMLPRLSGNLYAMLGWHIHESSGYTDFQIIMSLHSAEQPTVRTLNCNKRDSSYGNYYPTLNQIRQSLGSIIQITDNGL